jgi:hypothetical protein
VPARHVDQTLWTSMAFLSSSTTAHFEHWAAGSDRRSPLMLSRCRDLRTDPAPECEGDPSGEDLGRVTRQRAEYTSALASGP